VPTLICIDAFIGAGPVTRVKALTTYQARLRLQSLPRSRSSMTRTLTSRLNFHFWNPSFRKNFSGSWSRRKRRDRKLSTVGWTV